MTPTKLRLVSFGSALTLTRDLLSGPYTEINVFDSRDPAG
jgi:hypothetical protein